MHCPWLQKLKRRRLEGGRVPFLELLHFNPPGPEQDFLLFGDSGDHDKILMEIQTNVSRLLVQPDLLWMFTE
jgi:hypothetical protein